MSLTFERIICEQTECGIGMVGLSGEEYHTRSRQIIIICIICVDYIVLYSFKWRARSATPLRQTHLTQVDPTRLSADGRSNSGSGSMATAIRS